MRQKEKEYLPKIGQNSFPFYSTMLSKDTFIFLSKQSDRMF